MSDYSKTGTIFSQDDLLQRIKGEGGITPVCTGVEYNPDTSKILVSFDSALTAGEETTLDSVISVATTESIGHLIVRLITQAAAYYASKLASGYSYSGKFFSETAQAQAQWTAIKSGAVTIVHPYDFPTLDGTKYSTVDQTDFDALIDGVLGDIKSKTEAYRDACHDISTAVSKAAAQSAYDGYAV